MANKITNLISKLLLSVLILLMVAGVAVWGINDILIGSNNPTVAKVGNRGISETELQNSVSQTMRRISQSGFNNISDEFKTVIRNNALVNLVSEKLLLNEFDNLSILLPSKEVLKQD